MPVPISPQTVQRILTPRVGSRLLQAVPLAQKASELLSGFSPFSTTLEEVSQQLCNTLFNSLYDFLGPAMTVLLDNGRQMRIRMQDIPDIADDVMGALLDALPVTSSNLQMLREYALRQTSLSAMRVLLVKYPQPPEEKAILCRVIRDNYPPWRYESWLPQTS